MGWRSDYAHGEKDFIPDGIARLTDDESKREPLREIIPDLYRENGYRWLPLVREDWELSCDLDILFLRRDSPGGVIHAGDIDNRIKTLIDALRRPHSGQELGQHTSPAADEDPFYVLFEDDKNVTGLSVETDRLLWCPTEADQRYVRLVITVNVRPYTATLFNLGFAGD